jgi:beta-mannanase
VKYSKLFKFSIFFILLVLSAGFIYFRYGKGPGLPDELNDKAQNETLIAVYDRKHVIPESLPDQIQYLSIKWKNEGLASNSSDLKEKLSTSKNLLLTLEIWPAKNSNVLDEILKGTYDAKIRQLALFAGNRGGIMLRFLPEMEIPVRDFPWQYQSPEQYINAFNYFARQLKKNAPGIKMLWSPAGYPGDSEFWPGPDNVDAICITLGSKSEMKSKAYPVDSGLTVGLLKSKIHRMRFMDKPILILSAGWKAERPELSAMLKKVENQADSFKNTIYSSRYFHADIPAIIKRKTLMIGAYDPKQVLLKEPELTVEHLFTDWGEIQRGDFNRKFHEVTRRKHDVIVTMEPWRDITNREDSSVLQNTMQGKYDREIRELYRIISNSGQHVYLRWAHEMEIPIHRYSWQSKLPVDYINSYRYFMKFKKKDDQVSRVWGPAGDRGSADWYPGDDVVDYISIAIYGLPDKNITDEHQQESFRTIFQRKSYRMRFMNKPFFVTEFGVKGTAGYKKKWLEAAAETIRQNQQIFGICYFNLFDNPKAWGDIKAPDWSITKDIFKGFCKSLQTSTDY